MDATRDIPDTKVCAHCKTEKVAAEFRRNNSMRSGLYSYCMKCERKKNQEWRANNPKRLAEIQARRSAKTYEQRRDYVLRTQYGMTLVEYHERLAEQGGRCAICRTDNPGRGGRFVVDHCHAGGAVRGLLCNGCNVGLGHFRDDPTSLAVAIEYLKQS